MLPPRIVLIALLALFGAAHAVVRNGQCPEVTVQTDFNLPEYLGVWYEIKRYEEDFQLNLDCVTAEYTLADPNVARLTVVNSGYLFSEGTMTPFEARGVAVPSFPEDPRVPAKFSVAFFGAEPDRSNYWVLGSDYVNYSVVYSCEQLSADSYKELSWVLSRSKEMSAETLANIDRVLAENNVRVEDFRLTEQADCYGEIEPF